MCVSRALLGVRALWLCPSALVNFERAHGHGTCISGLYLLYLRSLLLGVAVFFVEFEFEFVVVVVVVVVAPTRGRRHCRSHRSYRSCGTAPRRRPSSQVNGCRLLLGALDDAHHTRRERG